MSKATGPRSGSRPETGGSLAEMAELSGIGYATLQSRLDRGWVGRESHRAGPRRQKNPGLEIPEFLEPDGGPRVPIEAKAWRQMGPFSRAAGSTPYDPFAIRCTVPTPMACSLAVLMTPIPPASVART